MFNVDADEFLYTQDKPIGKMLAEQDQDTRTLQVAVAEDVGLPTSVTGRAFRMKMPRSTVQEVFGARSGLVIRNHGMVGHSAGKSLLRAGMSGFKMRQHAIYRRGKAVVDKILGAEDGYCVLHFHNPGYDEWRRKLDYRLTNVGFRPRMRNALTDAREDGEEALKEIFAALYSIDERQKSSMLASNSLLCLNIDLDAYVPKYFG